MSQWRRLHPSDWDNLLDRMYRIGAGWLPYTDEHFIVYGVDRSRSLVVSYAANEDGEAFAYWVSGWTFIEYVGDYDVQWLDHVMLDHPQQEAS